VARERESGSGRGREGRREAGTEGGTDGQGVAGETEPEPEREAERGRAAKQQVGIDRLIVGDHWRDESIERLVGQKGRGSTDRWIDKVGGRRRRESSEGQS